MIHKLIMAAMVIPGALMFSSPSRADTLTYTFGGTVYNSSDPYGMFGSHPAGLNGDSFKLVFTFNYNSSNFFYTPEGTYPVGNTVNPDQTEISANNSLPPGASTSLGGAALTINGVTRVDAGNQADNVIGYAGENGFANVRNLCVSNSEHQCAGGSDEIVVFMQSNGTGNYIPYDVRTPFVLDLTKESAIGGFDLQHFDFAANGDLDITSLLITSSVPLPASLPMFASALLVAGVAGYRKSRGRVTAA